MWRWIFLGSVLVLTGGAIVVNHYMPSLLAPVRVKFRGSRSVDQVMKELQPKLGGKVSRMFGKAGCVFPGARLTYIALKRERFLEVWCARGDGKWGRVHEYRILAASGGPGPKLKQGDMQVPEGIYTITALNPNSRFHLSMKIGYPNRFDLDMAAADGRRNPGGDIFIHGSFFSSGCIAVGDGPAEELFYMTRKTGRSKVSVIVMPYDFRRKKPVPPLGSPAWTGQLYDLIHSSVRGFQQGG